MKRMSNGDKSLAKAHIALCIIFAFGAYVLYLYIFWDIIFGDLSITISIQSHRKTIIKNLNTYQRQELIHSLYNDYNEIYKAHWAIFSLKMFILVIAFIDSFFLITNIEKIYHKLEERK